MERRRSNFVRGILFTGALTACTDPTLPPDEAVPVDQTDPSAAERTVTTNARETLLYVAAVEKTSAGATASPDAIFTVDVAPWSSTYGKIIYRTDMTAVGDELHHFGYDWDQRHLIAGGIFSGRNHVIDVHTDSRRPAIEDVNNNLVSASGYVVPHTVIALPTGNSLMTMIGASASGFGAPGGVIEVDKDGNFVKNFGAGATRDYNAVGPKYMYDIGIKTDVHRMVSTTFGLPKDIAGGIDITNPTLGLGNEVCVWDYDSRQVLQRVDLGPGTGALEARWTNQPNEPVGYTNTPGTGAIWAWEDFDGDGVYAFHEVLTGLGIPTDLVMTSDSKYLYAADWGNGRVFQINITDRLNPVITATLNVPHAQMMRLSQDNRRLYVTNSLLSTWDDDPDLGGPRNATYGIYLININHTYGGMWFASNGNPLVNFTSIQKKYAVGAMRPHQIFFDPAVVSPFGFH
jgi:selenium-binding protein 1